jgi:hypothetical protein
LKPIFARRKIITLRICVGNLTPQKEISSAKSQKEKASAKSKSGDPQIQQILLVRKFANLQFAKLICGPPTFAILTT